MKEQLLMIGEAAKRLGVSVRTLQYYDKEGLVSPSYQSEGGRRLYSDKDIVKLNQILSLKYLGFSLDEIKGKILPMETSEDVIKVLDLQEKQISEQIESLITVQKSIISFKNEIIEMDTVNWSKYAGIISLLREKNEHYWIVKHFEENTLKSAAVKFDKESAAAFIDKLEGMWDRIIVLIETGEKENGEKAQVLAHEWWQMIEGFTGGDITILQDVMNFGAQINSWNNEVWKEKMVKTQDFLGKSLAIYFKNNGIEVKI